MNRPRSSPRIFLCAALALASVGLAPRPAAGQGLHVVVVAGLGGEPRYRELFHEWALQILDASAERFGVPATRLHYLGERVETDPARIRARSTSENVALTLREVGDASASGDRILIVLIGHGTGTPDGVRFNLPGPDPSLEEWDAMLAPLAGRAVGFVHTGSASGDFIAGLSGEGRVIITATRSAREQNETIFPRFFAEALGAPAADLDRDGAVSLLEAFEYARQEVARLYREEGRIQTEVALLEDDGDGVGSRAPGVDGADGDRARAFRLGGSGVAAAASADPALSPLLERRSALEAEIAALRSRRSELSESAYETALEELLVDLALVSREIRERGGD
jgi:hypothetical protein